MARLLLLVAMSSGLAAVAWGCGGLMQGQGLFNSPNFPGMYPNNQACSWVIKAEEDKLVKLQFTAFDLEYDMYCSYDYVRVYNGPSAASTLVGSFCGSTLPRDITGGNVITVVFKSDIATQMPGFAARFQSVDSSGAPVTASVTAAPVTAPQTPAATAATTTAARTTTTAAKPGGGGGRCGGDYASSVGSLSSPNYPSNYPDSSSCEYTITVPNSMVVLTFSAFDIELSVSCIYDYLEVRDGSATGNLLAKVCGNAIPAKIFSSGARLYIKFVSDSSVSRPGFLVSWQEVTCALKGGVCVGSNECIGMKDESVPCSGSDEVCCYPKLQQGECGTIPSTRIVGGNASIPHSWPWQASLQTANTPYHFCGASVITSEWVVTAAHCVDDSAPSSMQIVVGEHNLQEKGQEEVFAVKSYIMHERFNMKANGFPNDIALIRLARPIVFSRYVQPACLPDRNEEFFPYDNCWITGWGDTKGTADDSILNQLKINVMPRPECSSAWGEDHINDGHICVGDGLKGSCSGDSGGPLVCERNRDGRNRWILAGATSWGEENCRTAGYPSVYTRISYFLPWIEDKIRSYTYGSGV